MPVFTGLMGVMADCDDCGWHSEYRNALGNAKRHHNATGHTVHIEEHITICYASEESDYTKRYNERMNKLT